MLKKDKHKTHMTIPGSHKGLKFLCKIRKDPLNEFVNLMDKHGSHVWYEILGKKVLLLNDATSIEQVFQTNFKKYRKARFNDVLKPLLGNGIFLSEGTTWFKQRRESAPVFANKNFPEMIVQMTSAVESMFKRWDKQIENDQPINLDLETMWFTLDVVLRSLFHEERDDVAKGVKDSLGVLLKDAEKRIWALVSIPQSITFRLPKYKQASNFLDNLVKDLIEARRANVSYPDDLLSTLIDAYSTSQADQIILRDQVMSFLLAGHETTANGLVWAWYEICRRPEIKDRLTREVDEILGENKNPKLQDIDGLKYTSCIFEEAMRLYPPVWTMSREALEDDTLSLDDGSVIDVPKDTTVMLCAYGMHRNELYWKDPEGFDPSRFDQNKKSSRPKFAYFPFGGGARLCLGHKFAMIESVLAISMIAQRYDLTLLSGQDIKPEPIITLRPNNPVMFKVRHRKNMQTEAKVAAENVISAPRKINTCPFSHAEV